MPPSAQQSLEGVVHAGDQAGTVDRVNRHVEEGPGRRRRFRRCTTWGLVLLAFTDDVVPLKLTVERRLTRLIYGCTICEVLFACPLGPAACYSPDQFIAKVAIAWLLFVVAGFHLQISESTVGWLVLSSTKSRHR